jgi:hypothetical protein
MDAYTFALKLPLQIPSPTIPGAILFFPKEKFGLSYSIIPNPKASEMHVTLDVVELANPKNTFKVAAFSITENGFSTGVILNQVEVDAWHASATDLNGQLSLKYAELVDYQAQEQALIEAGLPVSNQLAQNIRKAQEDVDALIADITALGPEPIPDELFINKYADVIQYFDNTGAITPEGVLWAKSIPFMARTLGDYIV